MNLKTIIYSLLIIAVAFSSCKKEPVADGAKGETGEQGAPGINGSTILSGTGVPATTLGKDGDYYLDKATTIFYGPKAGSAWNTSVNLKGNTGDQGQTGIQGPAGTNGSTILNGTIAPAMSAGNIGDYYINTLTADFYGPKTTSSWGTPISLKGSTGSNGTGNIQIIFYLNQNFDNARLRFTSNPDDISPVYDWGGEYRFSPNNYTNISENGLVLVYLRDPNLSDGGWNTFIDQGKESNNYYDDSPYIYIYNMKTYISLQGFVSNYDPTGNVFKNYKFDIKVVMIPISMFTIMSAKHVDLKNIKAVENFLKLN